MITRNSFRMAAAVLASAVMVSSCVDYLGKPQTATIPEECDVPVVTAILPGSTDTRTALNYDSDVLKASWVKGDAFSVVPEGFGRQNAGTYTLKTEGGSTADFTCTKSVSASGSYYTAFYPSSIVGYATWSNVSYTGQVQKKSDPMAHLASRFCMMVDNMASYNTIDFSSGVISSCMRFNLSGMTFHSPSKIDVTLSGAKFVTNNDYNSINGSKFGYYYPSLESYTSPTKSQSIALDLEGYGDETNIIAHLMMSNADVVIPASSKVTVKVTCSDGVYVHNFDIASEMTLTGGRCHRITVDSDWTKSDADYTEYPFDGEVITLQETGSGLDLVVMGDGFIAEDITNGTYETILRKSIDDFFSVQPLTYFKKDFNIYIVKAVSPQRTNAITTGANGAQNTGTVTKFSCVFTPNSTRISGDDDKVGEYASKALKTDTDTRMGNACIVVIANQECRSGTCYNWWYTNISTDYGEAMSIAYFGRGTSADEGTQLMRHETDGHGFGKLADEYYYNQKYNDPSSAWTKLASQHAMGVDRNVDKYVSGTTDKTNVYWSFLFNTANNYETVEGLGVFEGAYTVNKDFCRPTQDGAKSIMNHNTGNFNAISRYQIWYRAMSLKGDITGNKFNDAATIARFLEWDKTEFLPSLKGKAPLSVEYVSPDALPLAPPVNRIGGWKNGKLVTEQCL